MIITVLFLEMFHKIYSLICVFCAFILFWISRFGHNYLKPNFSFDHLHHIRLYAKWEIRSTKSQRNHIITSVIYGQMPNFIWFGIQCVAGFVIERVRAHASKRPRTFIHIHCSIHLPFILIRSDLLESESKSQDILRT